MKKGLVRGIVMALCVGLVAPTAAYVMPGAVMVAEATGATETNDALAEVTEEALKEQTAILKAHKISLNPNSQEAEKIDKILAEVWEKFGYNGYSTYTEAIYKANYKTILELKADSKVFQDRMTAVVNPPVSSDDDDEDEDEKESTPAKADHFLMVGGSWVTPVANAGQMVSVVLPVVNMGKTDVSHAVVTPVLSTDTTVWPFEITNSNYSQVINDLPGTDTGMNDMDRRREVTWNLKTRSDVGSGYQKLSFDVVYRDSAGETQKTTLDTYIQLNGTAGVGADGQASVPRVIVTGFETNPEVVHAGESFVLTLHLKNTSTATSVSNMIFEIVAAAEGKDEDTTYAAFLPTAGSSTIFVDRIPKNGAKDIEIELEAKADLAQKPYVVDVNMSYEDEHVNAYTNKTSVSIPVKQEARVDISEPEIMPGSIEVGGESNIMFNIYNMGKTKLYNVQVKLQSETLSGGDAFIGNIDSGATGSVDIYAMGQAPTMDDGTVTILISYEDETGEATVIEKPINLYVSEPMMDDMFMDDMMMGDDMMMEEGGSSTMTYILIGVGVAALAAIAAVIVILRRKKKKAQAGLADDLLDLDDDDTTLS